MARIEEEATPIRSRAANERPSRYNSAVRHVAAINLRSPFGTAARPTFVGLAITVLLMACGHPATTGTSTAGKPTRGTKIVPTGGGGNVKPAGGAGTGSGAAAVANAPGLGCPVPSCAFHAGFGTYFTCTSGGGGACFHYGPACTPADACMFDPGDRTYKQCSKASEGTCQAWGAACAPTTKCMFSPQDGYHHHCDDVSGGTCKRYGAFCAP